MYFLFGSFIKNENFITKRGVFYILEHPVYATVTQESLKRFSVEFKIRKRLRMKSL